MFRAILVGLIGLGGVSLAQAAGGPQPITQYETPVENRWAPFSTDLPQCDDPSVLSSIQGRFADAENTFWGGQNAIAGIEKVREIGFRANGLAYIPRRFCVARATVVDPNTPPPEVPREHTVVYNVIASDGFAGWGWGVQWCVVGFDRDRAYEPDCGVLRPILERWLGETKAVGYGLKARY
jgi:hypothetical protein